MEHKTRITGEEVAVRGVTGEIAGRAPNRILPIAEQRPSVCFIPA